MKKPVKIACVVSEFPSLSETFILKQITGLIDLGHAVDVYSFNLPQQKIMHPEVIQYGLLKNVRYIPPVPKNKRTCRLTALKLLLKRFILNPVYTLRTLRSLFRDKRGFSYPNCFFALTVLRKKYDILLCHFGFNGNKGLHFKRIDPRLKLVTMFHGCDLRLGLEKGAGFYAELFSEGDLILANSQYMYDQLLGLGANPGKMKIHYETFDFDKFAGQQKTGKTVGQSLIILSVARLVEEKGLEFGLKAFGKLLDMNQGKSLRYIIVGGGYLEAELKRLAEDLSIEQNVYFAGQATNLEVVDYMKKADIFFLPSIKEAFPVVLLEAQAIGLAAVASDIAGVGEIILDGQSGFLVKSGDADDMADKLNFLINNPTIREQMSKRGRPHVREKSAAAVLNPKLEKLFIDLLTQPQ